MKPLEGMLVIAVEQAVAAPLCTARLADAGARVIKIERASGDFARNYDQAAGGASSYFAWLNHGKQSLVLDFKQEQDAALLHRLIGKADVLIQNLAPGAMLRAGFGANDLRDRHPQLVTCDISGYGEAPELAHLKAYDLLLQAESGLIEISGGPGEPGRIGISLCDIGAGITAHAAILEALLLRERRGNGSGGGSGVGVSLFDVAAEWMSVPFIHEVHGEGAPGRVGLHHPSIAPYGAYETRDRIKTIFSIQNEREWVRLCEQVLKQDDVAVDVRFNSNNVRVDNRVELDEIIHSVLRKIDAAEFRQRLRNAEIAIAGLNTVADMARHPALRQRKVSDAENSALALPAHPVRWAGLRSTEVGLVPEIGQHSKIIREEFSKG
jgi:itaconate CoA-transferase